MQYVTLAHEQVQMKQSAYLSCISGRINFKSGSQVHNNSFQYVSIPNRCLLCYPFGSYQLIELLLDSERPLNYMMDSENG